MHDWEGNLVDMWQMVADTVGNHDSVVDVGKEAQRADWNGQGALEVEIPDLRLVDTRNPFAVALTFRRPMEGGQALRKSPVG
jgi:hypothetical protein